MADVKIKSPVKSPVPAQSGKPSGSKTVNGEPGYQQRDKASYALDEVTYENPPKS